MPKITLPKELMLDLLEDETDVILDTIVDTSRWSIIHELIFRHEGKLYRTDYRVGATEQQDESPWEYEKEVECIEVEEYQVSSVGYRVVA